mmetsp:Transcript_3054/g.4422  ORF Transcript_3054/g.4422 Transcript_3054/m.4422 type:complete len:204 (-) Transcript_3054:162-773(-)
MANFIRSLTFQPATRRHFERRILANTSPQHLLSVISDVDKYEQFLPLCNASKVLTRSSCGNHYDASLQIGLPGSSAFQDEYVSRVSVNANVTPGEMSVEARSVKSNLFDSLSSRWKLREVAADANRMDSSDNNYNQGVSTYVEFEVELSVSNPVVVAVLDSVLEEVAGRQVQAFEDRCRELFANDLEDEQKNPTNGEDNVDLP